MDRASRLPPNPDACYNLHHPIHAAASTHLRSCGLPRPIPARNPGPRPSSGEFMAPRTKVLVTGGAGYIGSHCVRMLLARGYSVRVLDSLLWGDEALRPMMNGA